jgi:16S rRNA (adenine1518-N6/adenine1519-N6)-dimethyltransferase
MSKWRGFTKPQNRMTGNKPKPKKGLGQHFLVRRDVLDRIVALTKLRRDDDVIEIGTGLGDLTALLAEKGRHVWTLEIDRELFERGAERLSTYKNIHLLHEDALHYDYGLHRNSDQRSLKVVGNLPYYISTQILLRLLDYPGAFVRMVLMLQKEVVDRLAAQPATKQYGVLTLLVQPFYRVHREFVVPPEAFYPRPNVESAVVSMIQLKKAEIEPAVLPYYRRVVKAAFNQRRKTLRNALRHAFASAFAPEEVEAFIKSAGVDPDRRGETLDIEEFRRISLEIKERGQQAS